MPRPDVTISYAHALARVVSQQHPQWSEDAVLEEVSTALTAAHAFADIERGVTLALTSPSPERLDLLAHRLVCRNACTIPGVE